MNGSTLEPIGGSLQTNHDNNAKNNNTPQDSLSINPEYPVNCHETVKVDPRSSQQKRMDELRELRERGIAKQQSSSILSSSDGTNATTPTDMGTFFNSQRDLKDSIKQKELESMNLMHHCQNNEFEVRKEKLEKLRLHNHRYSPGRSPRKQLDRGDPLFLSDVSEENDDELQEHSMEWTQHDVDDSNNNNENNRQSEEMQNSTDHDVDAINEEGDSSSNIIRKEEEQEKESISTASTVDESSDQLGKDLEALEVNKIDSTGEDQSVAIGNVTTQEDGEVETIQQTEVQNENNDAGDLQETQRSKDGKEEQDIKTKVSWADQGEKSKEDREDKQKKNSTKEKKNRRSKIKESLNHLQWRGRRRYTSRQLSSGSLIPRYPRSHSADRNSSTKKPMKGRIRSRSTGSNNSRTRENRNNNMDESQHSMTSVDTNHSGATASSKGGDSVTRRSKRSTSKESNASSKRSSERRRHRHRRASTTNIPIDERPQFSSYVAYSPQHMEEIEQDISLDYDSTGSGISTRSNRSTASTRQKYNGSFDSNASVCSGYSTTNSSKIKKSKAKKKGKRKVLSCAAVWNPSLHVTSDGCDRCLILASEEEKADYQAKGHHPRIMMTRGGCGNSCKIFANLNMRLCQRCFHDTHMLKFYENENDKDS